jgi:hypothetical protein
MPDANSNRLVELYPQAMRSADAVRAIDKMAEEMAQEEFLARMERLPPTRTGDWGQGTGD